MFFKLGLLFFLSIFFSLFSQVSSIKIIAVSPNPKEDAYLTQYASQLFYLFRTKSTIRELRIDSLFGRTATKQGMIELIDDFSLTPRDTQLVIILGAFDPTRQSYLSDANGQSFDLLSSDITKLKTIYLCSSISNVVVDSFTSLPILSKDNFVLIHSPQSTPLFHTQIHTFFTNYVGAIPVQKEFSTIQDFLTHLSGKSILDYNNLETSILEHKLALYKYIPAEVVTNVKKVPMFKSVSNLSGETYYSRNFMVYDKASGYSVDKIKIGELEEYIIKTNAGGWLK